MRKHISKHFRHLRSIHSKPEEIALGFAIGTFIAVLPTFGLGALIGVLVILVKKDINKLALFAAFAVWNPLVLIPINTISYQIGDLLLQGSPLLQVDIEYADRLYRITKRLLAGSLLVSSFLSVLSYTIVYRGMRPIELPANDTHKP